MTQYRIITQQANVRNEPNKDAGVVAVLREGAIIHVDDERQPQGQWLPVLIIRAWVHGSVVEAME